jgi:predicted branched-subunit amino acid permease
LTESTNQNWEIERRRVLRDSLGVGIAVGSYGLSFGALAVANGLSVPQAMALSILTFTGGSQFALVSILGSGGTSIAAVGAAWMLAARNSLYGLRLAPTLKAHGPRRLLAAQLTIDESTAMSFAQPDQRSARLGFWATGAVVFIVWNLATVAGAVSTEAIGDPARFGLDAAVPAALLALVWPQLRRKDASITAILAAVVALALTPLLTVGLPVLLAAVVAIVVGWPEPRTKRVVNRE